jgi:hypothetical protein
VGDVFVADGVGETAVLATLHALQG